VSEVVELNGDLKSLPVETLPGWMLATKLPLEVGGAVDVFQAVLR